MIKDVNVLLAQTGQNNNKYLVALSLKVNLNVFMGHHVCICKFFRLLDI